MCLLDFLSCSWNFRLPVFWISFIESQSLIHWTLEHTSFISFSKISWRGILHSCRLYSQAMKQHPFASTEIRSHLKTNNNFLHHTLCDNRHHMTRTKCEMEEAGPFQIIPYFMGGAPKLTLFVSTSNRNHGSACLLYCTTYVEHMYVVCT